MWAIVLGVPSQVELVCSGASGTAKVLDSDRRGTVGDLDGDLNIVRTRGVVGVVEQRNLDGIPALVNPISRGQVVAVVRIQVHDLASLLSHRFSHHERGVIRCGGRPASEGRHVGGRRGEEVVELPRATVMEEHLRDSDGCGLEGAINEIESCSIGIRGTSEATARGGVGLQYYDTCECEVRVRQKDRTNGRSPCPQR